MIWYLVFIGHVVIAFLDVKTCEQSIMRRKCFSYLYIIIALKKFLRIKDGIFYYEKKFSL